MANICVHNNNDDESTRKLSPWNECCRMQAHFSVTLSKPDRPVGELHLRAYIAALPTNPPGCSVESPRMMVGKDVLT